MRRRLASLLFAISLCIPFLAILIRDHGRQQQPDLSQSVNVDYVAECVFAFGLLSCYSLPFLMIWLGCRIVDRRVKAEEEQSASKERESSRVQ
jgi:hypothetical protein